MAEANAKIYNKDELIAPPFMNNQFFEMALRKFENDENLKITDLKTKSGSKSGDHFGSIIFKVIISYTLKGNRYDDVSLIIKTMRVEENVKLDLIKNLTIFENEIVMYTKVLPEMQRLLSSIGDNEIFAPKLIYQSLSVPVIILEDIAEQGFTMADKLFDFHDTKLVILKLAKFHALSYRMNTENFDIHYKNTFISDEMQKTLKMFTQIFSALNDYVKLWPDFEIIAEKIDKLIPKIFGKLQKIYEPSKHSKDDFCVLNHGDFHLKNMMFKLKDDGQIENTLFLDYQLIFWGSPAMDLIHCLYMVGSEETRERKDELWCNYYHEFNKILEKLGCRRIPPSLLDLNIELLKYSFLEVFLSISFMPLLMIDMSQLDLEEYFKDMKKFGNLVFSNEEVQSVMKTLLRQFLHRGLLD